MNLKPSLVAALTLVKIALNADPLLIHHPLYSHDYDTLYDQYIYGQEPLIASLDELILSAIPSFNSFVGNTQVISRVCVQLNNQQTTPTATQSIITNVFNQTNTLVQQQQFLELCPAFKVIQYALEKQDLLFHKEVETSLYQRNNKSSLFMLAGYDNLIQSKKGSLSGYNSYNVDTPYQMLGFNQKYNDLKLIEAIGVSESYMQLKSSHARANFMTLWANMGTAYVSKGWQIGFDAQGGYSFLQTKRFINYLGLLASSNHNAWQASCVFRLGYDVESTHSSFTPYNNLSYMYGQENAYQEKGAIGANLSVKNEQISIIRNQVGFKLKKAVSRYAYILFDGAWLYEKYLNNQTYQAAFVGTNIYGSFQQNMPAHNYARFEAGFLFTKGCCDVELVYNGLYGNSFAESTASMKVGFKY